MNENRPANVSSTGCEVRRDNLTRQLYATDASLYQVIPAGVAFPRTALEAADAIHLAVDQGWSVIPRGAGTGLVGGAIGDGLIIDFARYNQAIAGFDREARTVRVGAGVVLDQLNDFLRPHGLWFGPDVATSSRATLGGMIANDSSGARVPVYGTTVDHVRSLELVLADGTIAEVSPEQASLAAQRAEIDGILDRYGTVIAAANPWDRSRKLKRRPGYGLARYQQKRGDLTGLISGSEGTLAAIFSATLQAVPLPRRRGLGLIFFASVADAMQATVELLDLEPVAIEHIDRMLFDQTRGQLAFAAARSLLSLDAMPAEAILIVEFFDDIDDRLAALASRGLGLRTLIVIDPSQQALVWGLRKAGLALLTGRPGPAKPVTGIEDAAVLPEQLPEYVAGLREILRPLAVEASFYGHAASGLLHVRPVLDLHTQEGIANLRHIADEVSALVRQFRGSVAGEHGVGMARTEYLAGHLGPELMAAHGELKRVFDPAGIMNPGKIVPCHSGSLPAGGQASVLSAAHGHGAGVEEGGPFRIDTRLRQGAGSQLELPFEPMLGFVDKDGALTGNLEQCSGVGACLKRTPAMCPTYIATGEEIMSTRGRANTIRAVLEHRVGAGADSILSDDLNAALKPCLSCKACKNECPSNVDLALMKAELLHERHRRSGVPLVDRLIASADLLGRLGSMAAPVANRLIRWRPVRRLMAWTLGFAPERTLPTYAGERFDTWFAWRRPADDSVVEGSRTCRPRRGRVVLWDDTWVRYHEPNIGKAAWRVLNRAGFEVALAHGRKCCGRPAFSRGLLEEAKRLGRHNVELLQREYKGLPVIFLEPSCLAMFLDEYRQLKIAGAEELARRCVSLEQFVDDLLAQAPDALSFVTQRGQVAIHAHCHARALTEVGVSARLAKRLPNVEADLLDTGCCGMAGAYGLMLDTFDLSVAVARPLVDKIRALPPTTQIVACGASCRHQIADLAGVRALHMAEFLAERLSTPQVWRTPDSLGSQPGGGAAELAG